MQFSHEFNQVGSGQILNEENESCLLILDRKVRNYPQLNARGERLTIRFVNPDMANVEGWLYRCVEEFLSTIKNDLNIHPADRVGINFANKRDADLNFAFSFRRFDQYIPSVIITGVENVVQSNAQFLIDDNLEIRVDHVKIPVGYGRFGYRYNHCKNICNKYK